MKTYLATFIPGFAEIIEKQLKKDISDIKIYYIDENEVLFQSDKSYKFLLQLKYLNNVFEVLHSIEWTEENRGYVSVVKELYKGVNYSQINSTASNFRMMIQQGSKLVHLPKEIQKKIIAKVAGRTKMDYSPLKADLEIWILVRKNNKAYFTLKDSSLPSVFKNIPIIKGQLNPRMAHMLNLVSEPDANDIYLDPFAGYGGLLLDRMSSFPYKQIYASDIEQPLIEKLQKKLKKKKNISVKVSYAYKLSYLDDNSVDKIVTDPPWGIFKMKNVDYEDFYQRILTEFIRVAKQDALIVVLTARKEEFISLLPNFDNLRLDKQFSTLVNGKKAGVFRLRVI